MHKHMWRFSFTYDIAHPWYIFECESPHCFGAFALTKERFWRGA